MIPKIKLTGKVRLSGTQRKLLQNIVDEELEYAPNLTEIYHITKIPVSTIHDLWTKLEKENNISLEINIREEGIEIPSQIEVKGLPTINKKQKIILDTILKNKITITFNKASLAKILGDHVSNIWNINERILRDNIINTKIIIEGKK